MGWLHYGSHVFIFIGSSYIAHDTETLTSVWFPLYRVYFASIQGLISNFAALVCVLYYVHRSGTS